MKDLFTVATYTIKDMIKRKSFIISNIIILLIIVIGFNVPNIIKTMTNGNETTTHSKILIIDADNVFEGTLGTLNNMDLEYEVEVSDTDINFEMIKERIEKDDIEASFVIKREESSIKIEYIVEDMVMMNEVPNEYINTLSTLYSNLQISKLNLSETQLQSLTPNFEFDITQTSDKEVSGNVFAIMLLSLVLFYAIYFCAYQVSTSITTEKTSKIMETLVTSTKPSTIVLGKTIGIGVVGLLQVILIVLVALICAKAFLDPELVNSLVDVSKITPELGLLTIIYFLLGYSAFALLYALTGSTVSKPEDVQSANGPVAILAVIGFYLAYFTMMNPTSELNVFASIFPLSAPFCMPFRVMMGVATWTEVTISIAILLVTIFIIAKISIRIYSQAILNYGSRMSIKDIIKMYKDKNN